ncbi:LPS-assembly protein LptD [Pseudooceanicola sp. MF1-13]|uniref:LPS-assembly protein LptD n=1 Tax=Pseudooceanicola sp. MF1-13 TaxID=3379095 RepID=UPI0038917DED
MILRLLALLLLLLPLPGLAQDTGAADDGPAMLVADRVWLEGKSRVVAEGSVEVLQGEARLRARRVSYDRDSEQLLIEGPIVLTRGEDEVIIADAAQLDRDLRNGIVQSARLVINQQLQLAAARLDRVDGRYAQLTRATVSSCKVCGTKAPLWQIKAKRVIHDREEMQLYFDDARMEVMGVPIFWTPRLRLPDPNQTRATGFLIPSIKRNSQLLTGVKIPYFIKLGDHRDLTLTPYLSSETRTVEWRYRQAFVNGRITFNGAVSQDSLIAPNRAYIRGTGQFDLARDYELTFQLEGVTDDAYLSDYGYSDDDLLESNLIISRTQRDEYVEARLSHYYTLRPGELNNQIPSIVGDLIYERRLFPRQGGELRLSAEQHSHLRTSNSAILGRDVARISAGAEWFNTWTLPLGIRAEGLVGVQADSFATRQDPTFPSNQANVAPTAAITLRWPWVRTQNGISEVIEPVAMAAWTGGTGLNVANDESTRVEFDEGNLLSLSRFPAPDRREVGFRGAVGINWTRINPDGWDARLTLGTVYRETRDANFTLSSGLRNTASDLLIAGQFRSKHGITLTGRGLFNEGFGVNKAEARATWTSKRYDLSASYVWLSADPTEGRPNKVSEWLFSSGFDLGRHLRGSLSGRYDIVADQPISAGVGLTYTNECVEMQLSASRRFASSTIVTPATDFAFTIGLRGFSASSSGRGVARVCR